MTEFIVVRVEEFKLPVRQLPLRNIFVALDVLVAGLVFIFNPILLRLLFKDGFARFISGNSLERHCILLISSDLALFSLLTLTFLSGSLSISGLAFSYLLTGTSSRILRITIEARVMTFCLKGRSTLLLLSFLLQHELKEWILPLNLCFHPDVSFPVHFEVVWVTCPVVLGEYVVDHGLAVLGVFGPGEAALCHFFYPLHFMLLFQEIVGVLVDGLATSPGERRSNLRLQLLFNFCLLSTRDCQKFHFLNFL